MPTSIIPAPTFYGIGNTLVAFNAPADGDADAAASVNVAFQALCNAVASAQKYGVTCDSAGTYYILNGLALALAAVTQAGSGTVAGFSVVTIETTTGAQTVTLPASPVAGQIIVVKNGTSGVGPITVKAAVNIDGTAGATGLVISSAWGALRFIFANSQWYTW